MGHILENTSDQIKHLNKKKSQLDGQHSSEFMLLRQIAHKISMFGLESFNFMHPTSFTSPFLPCC